MEFVNCHFYFVNCHFYFLLLLAFLLIALQEHLFIAKFLVYLVMFCRVDDAIEILEYVVGMREEKLGTANPDVDDEKRRLEELLKEAGRARNRRSRRSLETLLETNSQIIKNSGIKVL